MRKLLLLVAIALLAVPAVAGQWLPAYTWTAEAYGGVKYLNNWGLGCEGGLNWNVDPPTNQDQEWVADRTGLYLAEEDIMLASGKIKWRTDTGLPAGGPGLSYTDKLGMTLGIKVGGSPSGGYPAVYLRNNRGGVKIGYTTSPTTVLGVQTNWNSTSTKSIVDGITGNWLQPLDTWSWLKVTMNQTTTVIGGVTYYTWDAWLNNEANHMWGHVTGDSGTYMQFGFLGTVNNQTATYDFVAFGSGDANIGAVPEPGSLLALGTGLAAMAGLGLRRRA